MLPRARGEAQLGKSDQLFGVAAEVCGDAEMGGEVEGALRFPSIEVAAKVAAAKAATKTVAKAVVVV